MHLSDIFLFNIISKEHYFYHALYSWNYPTLEACTFGSESTYADSGAFFRMGTDSIPFSAYIKRCPSSLPFAESLAAAHSQAEWVSCCWRKFMNSAIQLIYEYANLRVRLGGVPQNGGGRIRPAAGGCPLRLKICFHRRKVHSEF